jgi:hypothetical protein
MSTKFHMLKYEVDAANHELSRPELLVTLGSLRFAM